MATEDLLIIAIELGSSKVTGIGGRKLADGSIQVEAVAQEPSSKIIRRGILYNVDKSAQCVTTIIEKLQSQLKRTVTQVYVGFGGQSICSDLNTVRKNFDGEVPISKDIVEELMQEDLNANTGDKDILEVIPQEYKVGSGKQIDPVGVLSDKIEGHFLNIMARSSLRANIDMCFDKVGKHIVEYKLVPLTVADEVLSETEKRSGCVLVDFGAETTTVSVYKANLLRYISVIPIGSNNITKDIMSCQLEEKEAEELKITYGSAVYDLSEEEANAVVYTLPDHTKIDKGMLTRVVEARVAEILDNVKDAIKASGYNSENLIAGAWLIGGGSKLKNMSKAFSAITGFDKVNIPKTLPTSIHFAKNIAKSANVDLLGTASLLFHGTQTCATALAVEPAEGGNGGLFASGATATPPEQGETKKETAKSKQKTEKPPRKGVGFFKKVANKLGDFSKKIVEED